MISIPVSIGVFIVLMFLSWLASKLPEKPKTHSRIINWNVINYWNQPKKGG